MIKKFLLLLLCPMLLFSQHTIKGTFTPADNYNFAILYHITPKGAYYKVDTKTTKEGTFELKLDTTITKGIYKLVYGLPQEQLNFDIFYDGKEDIELTFNEKDGVVFTVSEQNKLLFKYLKEIEAIQTEIDTEYKSDDPNKKNLKQLLKTQAAIQTNAEKASKDSFASTFINANRPYIPSDFESYETYLKNQETNYFKYFDFKDLQLQSSSFPINRIVNYYDLFTSKEDATSIETTINEIGAQLKDTKKDFQKSLLDNFWQALVASNDIEAANYLAESYLIPLCKSTGDVELENQLVLFKNTSLGTKAPDFSWTEEEKVKKKTQTLHGQQGAENYILVFWSAECSHCLKEIPMLYSKIISLPQGKFKVIAVGLENEPYEWKNKIIDLPNFTHVLGSNKWENEIGKKYGIMQTPTYFVLDKDKKIIAKPNELEDLELIIDSLDK